MSNRGTKKRGQNVFTKFKRYYATLHCELWSEAKRLFSMKEPIYRLSIYWNAEYRYDDKSL